MPTARVLISSLDLAIKDAGSNIDPCSLSWLRQLEDIIDEYVPDLTHMQLFTVYKFYTKKYGWMRGIVTKENAKTWILYETSGSFRPGCRWTWAKNLCTKDVMIRDSSQSYEMPATVKFK